MVIRNTMTITMFLMPMIINMMVIMTVMTATMTMIIVIPLLVVMMMVVKKVTILSTFVTVVMIKMVVVMLLAVNVTIDVVLLLMAMLIMITLSFCIIDNYKKCNSYYFPIMYFMTVVSYIIINIFAVVAQLLCHVCIALSSLNQARVTQHGRLFQVLDVKVC